MRHVGTLPPGLPAGGLLAALAERGLEVRLQGGELWALDEESRRAVRHELERFRRAPQAAHWRDACRAALRRSEMERARDRAELGRRSRRCSRRDRRLRRLFASAPLERPLTLLLLACGALLGWAGPPDAAAWLPVLASCYWIHALGSEVEPLHGTARFAVLVLGLTASTSAVVLLAGHSGAGLSGLAFGLLGFTAASAGLDSRSGLAVPRGLFMPMAAWLLACAAGAAPASVFLAQCAGLLAGLLAGGIAASTRRALA